MFQANQRVGEYILDEPLAQTAYAEEWRAHHHMWSDQLALVKIPTDPQYVANLQQQGIRLHRLVHPNILVPLGFDPHAQPPYLITEYVKGETLRPWINEKRLSITQSVNILRQVLEALQFGHERNVIHGDIRPENIFLDGSAVSSDFARTGSVKLTDFGVGQAVAALVAKDAASNTQSQAGSLAYLAPEQRDGAAPDVKSDIYGVGAVLFEMLTGERASGAELPSEINSEVPAWLDEAFKKSYARRERRFESAKAFLAALTAQDSIATSHGAPPMAAGATELRFRSTGDDPPPPSSSEMLQTETGGEIGLAAEDDVSAGSSGAGEYAAESTGDAGGVETYETEQEPQTEAGAEPEPEPVDEEQLEEQQEVGADTAQLAADPTGGEPVLPAIPRVVSPADKEALFDELNKRQVRTIDDLKNALKGYFEMRDLDQGESANIRLRLLKWANGLAGGSAELENQVVLINAAARPFYIVKLLLRSTRGEEPARSQSLEHPIGEPATMALRSGDYRLIAHFSATTLSEKMLESIASIPLRTVIIGMTREARRELFGRITREDVLIYRANVLTAAYRFDAKKYRAFMVGNALSVVSAGEPFTKIRQEPTKRAATLLNGEQVGLGIKELRRALDDPQWESKANGILSAWRGKLAAAYMVEAKQVFKNFGWLESLEDSTKAGQLVPGHEDALSHVSLVRKRISQLQLLPGMIIGAILIGLAILWSFQQVKPLEMKPLMIFLGQSSLLAAGVATWIATIWSNAVLKARMGRTDFAFYQAAVFPLLIALSLAFVTYQNSTSDVICGVLLVVVIVADVMVFKKLRKHLIRPVQESGMPGDGLTVLNKIEHMLSQDWETIRGHYLELGPLYSYTSVHATQAAMGELFQQSSGGSNDDTAGGTTVGGEWKTDEEESPTADIDAEIETGHPEVDRLVGQMNARISASLRTLAPSARMVMTIFGEYTKAVNNRQLGMIQANAGKMEQKGKDLAGKLADFERLCKSPLSLGSGEDAQLLKEASRRLAARAESSDVNLLKTLAERAKAFREDQTGAAGDITAMASQVEEVIEKLKKG